MIDTILINIKIEDQIPDAVGPVFQKTDLTLIRMTKDEKGLAFFKGLLL